MPEAWRSSAAALAGPGGLSGRFAGGALVATVRRGAHPLPPTGPAFSVVLLLHIASAIVGFGAMVLTGVQGARLRRGPDAPGAAAVARFFRPGTNWAARAVYLVPVLGLTLVAMSRGAFDLGDGFVDIGLGIWLTSVLVAELVLWPGERRIQQALAGGWPDTVDGELDRACRQVAWCAPVLAAAFVGAASVMVIKP